MKADKINNSLKHIKNAQITLKSYGISMIFIGLPQGKLRLHQGQLLRNRPDSWNRAKFIA